MALVSATLASEIEALPLVDVEIEAINNFVAAWKNYFMNASVLGIPVFVMPVPPPPEPPEEPPLPPCILDPALTAMKGAMVGSFSTAGSVALKAGITAFWGVVAGSAATIWITVPPVLSATPPPLLGTIDVALDAVFLANTQGKLEKGPAALAIANVLHPLQLGGIAAITPPPPAITAPIL